jgi:8-oxo-dGTP pyrophosphatase MutT (NUDIX family)
MQKIYFNHKPLFICSTITPEIDEYLHQGTTIFIDEFNKHTVETIIEEMQRPEINAGVFLHGDEEEVLDAIKQNLTLVKAAGGLVQVIGEQFLLIYRRGKWDLPKGKLDEGEDLKTCAVREVEEETGIRNVNIQDLLSITYHTYYENGLFILKETHWFLMSTDRVQPFIPQINEDIEKCEWVKIDGLAPYMENTHPSVLEVVKKGTEVLKAARKV